VKIGWVSVADGRRVTKDVNGSKTAYFHDGLNVVAEYNGSDQLQRTYVTPGLDQNLTMTASGSTYYYPADALGSIRQVINANEATQDGRGRVASSFGGFSTPGGTSGGRRARGGGARLSLSARCASSSASGGRT